jgi:anhydro-N-acetylmuramic acid kinase
MTTHFVGLMSGTSLDGIDGVLIDLLPANSLALRGLAHVHVPFSASLRHELFELNAPGENELHRAALAANALARQYAQVVELLLTRASLGRNQVAAIGAHGQTVRHRPREFDGTGYSTQLLAPALLAELTGIDVICDFRSRDIAAGGQGAPLVPAFHRAVFGRHAAAVAVLNIGGISNLTVIESDFVTCGFDCGPGNALMDYWCQRHTGARYDDRGAWAAAGEVNVGLLETFLREPYFALPPPKSTGRDLFNPAWLESCLRQVAQPLEPVHAQATLAELTASVCATSVLTHARSATVLVICGGGAFNEHLKRRIAAHLPTVRVSTSDECGVPPDQVEACAFAWLAQAFVDRRPGNLSAATGAQAERVLGALYPAR